GGMAAFIPSRRDPEINAVAFAKVRADKTREAVAGYEGSWVAHPDLVPICQEIFDAALGDRVNQLSKPRQPVDVNAKDLLDIRSLPLMVTAKGLRDNIEVALEYVVNWLAGNGAVGINNLMEDAATAEISRCQVWQWRRNRVVLDIERQVTTEMIVWLLDEATETLADTWSETPGGKELLAGARNLLYDLCTKDRFVDFLTLPAYALLP
ncbi:MAG TPA: malate synthase A, partial [Nakamurella sp.]